MLCMSLYNGTAALLSFVEISGYAKALLISNNNLR